MYDLQANAKGTLSARFAAGATSATLNSGHTFQDATKIILAVQPDVDGSYELIEGTISGDSITSITRAKDGTSDVEHPANSKVWGVFSPSNYTDVTNNGVLGYAEIKGDFSSGTSDADVDVTGLSTTVTVPAGGRRVKITVYSTYISSTSTSATIFTVSLKEGSTVLQTFSPIKTASSSDRRGVNLCYVGTPTAGSHTYKVAIKQNTAGTMSLGAGGTAPAFILVEYLGGV